jgi:hypothetical protein
MALNINITSPEFRRFNIASRYFSEQQTSWRIMSDIPKTSCGHEGDIWIATVNEYT